MDASSEDERELQRPRLMPVTGPKNARRRARIPPEEEAGPSEAPRKAARVKNAGRGRNLGMLNSFSSLMYRGAPTQPLPTHAAVQTSFSGPAAVLQIQQQTGVRAKNARRPGGSQEKHSSSSGSGPASSNPSISSTDVSEGVRRAPRPKNARTKRSGAGPPEVPATHRRDPPGPRRAFFDYDVAETHTVTPEEAAQLERDVRVVRIKNKGGGLGVRTNRALPKGTYVGSLVGNVYKSREHDRLVNRGSLSGKYGMDLAGNHVVDIEEPMDRPGPPVLQTYEEAVAHRINEPNPNEVTSAVWRVNGNVGGVVNRMDVYTDRDLGKNQEVLIHYGDYYHQGMQEGDPGYYPAPSVESKGEFRVRKGTDPRDPRWLRHLEDAPRLPSLGTESDEAAQRRLRRKRSTTRIPNCVLGAVC